MKGLAWRILFTVVFAFTYSNDHLRDFIQDMTGTSGFTGVLAVSGVSALIASTILYLARRAD